MGINAVDLCRHYPRLYHMAHVDSWENIRLHGLLSTTAVLDLVGLKGDDRIAIECQRRGEAVRLDHPLHGSFVVRDQKPIHESKLEKCLEDGLKPEDWLRILNGKVFFWLTDERVKTLLGARAYRFEHHLVITLDTASVLAKYEDRVSLSPINAGSTFYNPQPRGLRTFLPLQEYPYAQRVRMRGRKNAIAELAVDYAVESIAEIATKVEIRSVDAREEIVWERS